MDDSMVMSTEAIFVYYSLLLFRVATGVSSLHLELKVPGSNLAWYTPFFFLHVSKFYLIFFVTTNLLS